MAKAPFQHQSGLRVFNWGGWPGLIPARSWLLLSGATAALILGSQTQAVAMSSLPVPVGCVAAPSGDTVNCKGDLAIGIPIFDPLPSGSLTLNVSDVRGDIKPEELPGIWVSSERDVVINSELGTSRIIANGPSAPGILAFGSTVTINHSGDITATGYGSFGIFAFGSACVECSETGPIDGPAEASVATVSITSQGDITVGASAVAIAGVAATGDVVIKSTGNIKAAANSAGIIAVSNGPDSPFGESGLGDIIVTSIGNITLTSERKAEEGYLSELHTALPPENAGILVYNGGDGSAFVNSAGNISTTMDGRSGIAAYATGLNPFETVFVASIGDITTTGNRAYGIVAGSSFADVEVEVKGNITTTGAKADGVYAYSNSGGDVSVMTLAKIAASGRDSYGIAIEGDGDLSVTILGGTVSGGSNDGTSVAFFGGMDNRLVNRGTILGGGSGWALEGSTAAADAIDNYGTITGNVEMAIDIDDVSAAKVLFAEDSLYNRAGANFNAGEIVQLGGNGLVYNEGVLNPGGSGNVLTTTLTGRLQQSATGVLGIDIAGNKADRIDIETSAPLFTGAPTASLPADTRSALMAGKIAPRLASFDTATAKQQFTILTGSGDITDNGLTVADTALADYTLIYPNTREVVLQIEAHFASSGLSANQNAVLDYLRALIGSGLPDGFGDVYATFLNAPDAATAGALADQIGTLSGSSAVNALLSSEAFAQALRSCPVAEGPYGQLRETSCVWAKPGAREFSQDGGPGGSEIESNTSGLMGGVQSQIGENVWAGAGFAIEESATTAGTSQIDGTWWQLGGVAKWANGPWKLSGSISGGQGNIDTTRFIGFPGLNASAESATDVTTVSSLARLAYSFGATGLYVTPMVDFGATWLKMGGFSEQGAGILNLTVASADQWVFSAGPAVEIGATLILDGITLRPYVKTGVTFLSEDSFDLDSRFTAASASAASLAAASQFDDVYATLDAGVQLFSAEGLNLRLNYQGRFGEDSRQNGVDAKLSINY